MIKFIMIQKDWIVRGIVLNINYLYFEFICLSDSHNIHQEGESSFFMINSSFYNNCKIIGKSSKEEIVVELL